MTTSNNTIPNATIPYEVVYIHAGLIKTQDGDCFMVVSIDEFTEFSFEPVVALKPTQNEGVMKIIEKAINNILNTRKGIPKYIVTNLDETSRPLIEMLTGRQSEVIFDDERTEKFVTPLLGKVFEGK